MPAGYLAQFLWWHGAAFGIEGGVARDDLPAMAQPGLDLGQVIADRLSRFLNGSQLVRSL